MRSTANAPRSSNGVANAGIIPVSGFMIGSNKSFYSPLSPWISRESFAAGLIRRGGRFLGRGFFCVERLQRLDIERVFNQCADPQCRGIRGGERRNTGNIVTNGGPPDGLLIIERLPAERSIDDHIDLPCLYQVDD